MTLINKNEQVKLAISICANRPMPPRCAISLAMIIHYVTAFQIPFAMICRLQASLLPQARQECLDEAIADGCTHQLWLDDDIEAPGDCVLRMLHNMHANPEIDIIAANYCRKQEDLQYTAEGMDGRMMESAGKIGLEEATKIGAGLMLLRLERIKSIPRPHFEVIWSEKYNRYQGEDRYFIDKLQKAGIRVFVDHGISNWCQHYGEIGYSPRIFGKDTDKSTHPYATLEFGPK